MLPQANLGKKQYVSNCDSCYRTNSHHPTDHDRTLLRLQLHWLCGLRSSQNHRTLLQFFCFAFGNKATGWLAALVKATNLKLWFLRLRDKMLVFAGLVKACLQYGYSFRLACVWLKRKKLRFGCAVKRFCSSIKNMRNFMKFMIFNHLNHLRKTSSHPVFSLLEVSVPECFWQRSGHRLQQGDIITHVQL